MGTSHYIGIYFILANSLTTGFIICTRWTQKVITIVVNTKVNCTISILGQHSKICLIYCIYLSGIQSKLCTGRFDNQWENNQNLHNYGNQSIHKDPVPLLQFEWLRTTLHTVHLISTCWKVVLSQAVWVISSSSIVWQ